MRNQPRTVTSAVTVTLALGLAILGWTRMAPANAQNDPVPGQGNNRGRMMGGPASIAASGDYVFVLRGGTVYQMKVSDLSLVSQKDLPAPGEVAPDPNKN